MKVSSDVKPTGIRMPQEIKDQLIASANESGRSLNSEVVHRLKRSLVNDKQTS